MNQCVKKISRLMIDRHGSGEPLVIATVLAMLFIILGVGEYMRLMITAAGIKDATESAVISVINDNYDEVYHGVREGYAAGYVSDGATFFPVVDYGDIYGRLGFLLGLTEDGNGYVRMNNDGEREYRISGLQVRIPNTPIGVSGGTYYAEATIQLEIPVRFGGKILSTMTMNIKAKAAYKEKF